MSKNIRVPLKVIGKTSSPAPLTRKPSEDKGDFFFDTVGELQFKTQAWKATQRENQGFVGEFNDRYSTILDGFSPSKGTANNSDVYSVTDAIRIAQMVYWNDSTIRNTIDTLVELASEGLYFKHRSEQVQKFYTAWAKQIGFDDFLTAILLEYFRSGNVAIYRFDGTITSEDRQQILRSMSSGPSRKSKLSEAVKTVMLPVRYTILNPLTLQTIGSNALGTLQYAFNLPYDEAKMISDPTTEQEIKIVEKLPPSFVRSVKKAIEEQGRIKLTSNSLVKIPLDPDQLTMIFRAKQPYEAFAVPFLFAVADDVAYKKELRNLDRAASRAVTRNLLHVKIGDKDNPPKKKHYDDVRQVLASGSISQYLITPYHVQIDQLIPPIDKILGSDKFNSVDKDIMKGLGVSEILLGGAGGSFSNAFLSIKALLERLDEARTKVVDQFIRIELKRVADVMGFQQIPEPRFAVMNLRDENAERRILYQLVQGGVISPRSAISVLNSGEWPSWDEETKWQEEWKNYRKKGMFISVNERTLLEAPKVPGTPPGTPSRPKRSQEPPGRPPGTTKKQEKVREGTPKGLNASSPPNISVLANISQMMGRLIPIAENLLVEKLKRALETNEKKEAEWIAVKALCYLAPDSNYLACSQAVAKIIASNLPPPNDVIYNKQDQIDERIQDVLIWLVENWS